MPAALPAPGQGTVVFVANEYSEVEPLVALAETVRRKCGRPVVLYARTNLRKRSVVKELRGRLTFPVVVSGDGDMPPGALWRRAQRLLLSAAVTVCAAGSALCLRGGLRQKFHYVLAALRAFQQTFYERSRAAALLHRLEPDAVVTAKWSLQGADGAWLDAARRAGLPRALFFQAMVARGLRDRIITRPELHSPSQIPFRLFWQQTRKLRTEKRESQELLPISSDIFLGAVMAGARIEGDPWYGTTCAVDQVFFESDRLAAAYAASGANTVRRNVVGSPRLDEMARMVENVADKRQELSRLFSLDPSAAIILVAVPKRATIFRGSDYESHLSEEFIEIVETLKSSPDQILYSLHPSTSETVIRYLRKRHLPCSVGGIGDQLPLVDGFITGFSTVARWGLALGVPTVIVDGSGLAGDFAELAGYREETRCRIVPDIASAEPAIHELRRAGTAGRFPDPTWGPVDGQSCQRFAAELEAMIRRHGARPEIAGSQAVPAQTVQRT